MNEQKTFYGVLFQFAKKHHEVCEDCEGTGKIYKHADPTSGQWVPCPVQEILEGRKPFG